LNGNPVAAEENPLLDFSGLPRFSTVRPAHVGPAIGLLLAEARALVRRLEQSSTPATWKDFVQPLESANERLSRAWGIVGHLHGVLDSPELREAYNANQTEVVKFSTELGQNVALFGKFKALRASPEFDQLSPAQRKIVENEIRDFRLTGAELPEDKKKRFAQIQEELAALSTRFSENVLDSTNAFVVLLKDASELTGLPPDVVESARAAAEKDGLDGWKLTLQAPCYIAVVQYSDNRALREVMYRGYVTRASEEFAGALERKRAYERPAGGASAAGAHPVEDAARWDNTANIDRILALRNESARLLGYANYAELSLVPKMAESPQQVLEFLESLAENAMPFAGRDYAELKEFARAELGIEDLQAWDVPWASEKLRVRRYAFSEQEVKQYFPEPKVLQGMFGVVEKLYGIRIEPDVAEVWDPTVRFFRIVAAADRRGAEAPVLGQFYLDAYARETKRGGAWMDEAITRHRTDAGVQAPVAYLVCNFSAPVGDKPALLTHDDVLTLFHEFGHGLHHLLSRVDHLGVSGIRGVEWDAVELPSQFMENFCWEWEVLSRMTSYAGEGAARGTPLPRELYDKMLAAKNFQSGMQMVRQLEFALFDMRLHVEYDPDKGGPWLRLLDEVRSRVAVVPSPPYNRLPNSFSHLFAGAGYAAGYYSYKWAEVLSADAFSVFEEHRSTEHGVLDPGTGLRFLEEILAVGGSRPAIESFKAFRGRAPNVDALLRHNGMIAA
jgi:oligopeptidase A